MTKTVIDTRWTYRLGKPIATGQLKVNPEDFVVTEQLGYELTGEGEHFFLWIEKQGLNTAYVAESLAKHTGLPLRQVTYAGRKDKHAVTRQWIGLHAPKGLKADPVTLDLPGFRVIASHKHNKKLKVGQLEGNLFSLTLRNVTDVSELEKRLAIIKKEGVPNYFGDQRFGVMRKTDGLVQVGGTLQLGLNMVDGEPVRNRNKRNMALSALRSALFNTLLSKRVKEGFFDTVKQGDACALSGSNSYFIEEGNTLIDSQQRYISGDISPTAPLVGEEKLSVTDEIKEWEENTLIHHLSIVNTLQKEGLNTMRRAIKLWPKSLEWQKNDDNLHIQFSLPAGCFATSILRECVQFQPSDDSGND